MDTNRIIRIILTAVLGLIFLVILITGANIFFFWSIFNWLQGIIGQISGWDGLFAKGIAALLMTGVVVLPLGSLLKAWMPIPQKHKSLYRAAAFAIIAVFFLVIFFAGRNTFFDPATGKPVKYYSENPEGGYKFYSKPGFDPVTGDELKVVTKEIILKSKGLYRPPPEPAKVYPPEPRKTPPPEKSTSYQEPPEMEKPKQTEPKAYVIEPEPLTTSKPDHGQRVITTAVPRETAKEVPRTYVPKTAHKEPAPVDTRCFVTLSNSSNNSFVLLRQNGTRVLDLGSHCKVALKMEPGTYYLRNVINKHEQTTVEVPNGKTLLFEVKQKPVNVAKNYRAPVKRYVRHY